MTAQTEQPDALVLPLVRSPGGRRPRFNAQERPHAHEAGTPIPQPEREPRQFSVKLKMPMPSARAVSGILAGGSLMATTQPAVLTVWAGHRQAAEFYRHWFAKYPRLAYGAGHAFIEVPFLYLWAWSGHSPVLRAVVVAVILIILRLLGVHVLWSWL